MCLYLDELGDLVAEARRNNIEFVYAIAPGLNMVYSSEQEQQLLHVSEVSLKV